MTKYSHRGLSRTRKPSLHQPQGRPKHPQSAPQHRQKYLVLHRQQQPLDTNPPEAKQGLGREQSQLAKSQTPEVIQRERRLHCML